MNTQDINLGSVDRNGEWAEMIISNDWRLLVSQRFRT